ncbi:MAG: DMT family transporter [Thermoplasmatota archaeon]
MAERSRRVAGAWFAAASAVSYGTLAVLTKLAYGEGWNIPSLLSIRFLLAGLTVLPFVFADRSDGGWRGAGIAFLVGMVGYAGTTALYFPAIQYLPPAIASFLLYLAPPLVAVFAWLLLGERLGLRGVAAIALGLLGLALLAWGAVTGRLPAVGVALAAGSAVVYAGTVLASRQLMRNMSWPRATVMVCAGACTSYVVFSLATRSFVIPPSPRGVLYAAGIGVIATGLPLSLFMAALPRIGAARTAVISTLEPVSTLVIAAMVFPGLPSLSDIVGGLLIVAAAALVAFDAVPTNVPAE